MKYIKATTIKQYAHGRHKRVTRGFLFWLDKKVEGMLDRHIHILGSRSTLDAQEAALLWK